MVKKLFVYNSAKKAPEYPLVIYKCGKRNKILVFMVLLW